MIEHSMERNSVFSFQFSVFLAHFKSLNIYAAFLRPLLFRLNPERAHHLAVEACRFAGLMPSVPQLSRAFLEYSAPELETGCVPKNSVRCIGDEGIPNLFRFPALVN